ncbi:MAG: hypothetical protein ACR2F2_07100 [Pyrinomonadaceae bacterium]
MRSKDIISTIAFISAFAISAAFASFFIDESQTNFGTFEKRNDRSSNCRSADKTCADISALLIQDIRNGDQRRNRYDYSLGDEGNISVRRAETVADYSDASMSMEDAHLPSDFRTAWRAHMKAWRDYSEFLNDSSRKKIEDEEFDRLEIRYIYDINKTWATVLKIGRGYGADSPYIY